MTELLNIEWLKIKRYRTFWILTGLFVLLLPLWNYQVAKGMITMGSKGGPSFLNTAYTFPEVWANIGFWASYFIWFLAILIIIVTTNEYQFRTNRQNVIDGWSRMQFFHAKAGMVVVLSIAATAYVFALGALFGLVSSGSLRFVLWEFRQVGYFFILSLDYLGFALLIAIWIRRSGLAISLFLLYTMIIENILKTVINHQSNMPYGGLLPLQASDELLPFPVLQMAKNILPTGDAIPVTTLLMAATAWIFAYYFIARTILLRRDW
jgi:ABC-2 type transport system permease protein